MTDITRISQTLFHLHSRQLPSQFNKT